VEAGITAGNGSFTASDVARKIGYGIMLDFCCQWIFEFCSRVEGLQVIEFTS